jgi:hypothetical protein
MLRISQLLIYPIKSLGGISLDRVRVSDRGFQHDRRWMLVNEDHGFITQRTVPLMALIRVAVGVDGLHITSQLHSSALFVPFGGYLPEFADVYIWEDTCMAQFVSDEADAWFAAALKIPCRLVYMPEETARVTDPEYAPEGSITSFADAFPFLLIGQASLDELNSRLEQALPMDRFRPNIVFTGGYPYQEDELREFSIRGIRFGGVKPCARCPIPTIDQATAERGKEPLRTLARYRFWNNKVYFGQNLVHQGFGELAVGDELVLG